MAEIKITNENFENEVLKSDIPVLVDFYATWCGPCKMIAPFIEEISNEYAGKIKVGKIDVDDSAELAIAFGVSSIPTVIVFKNGEIHKKAVGYRSKKELEDLLP